MTLHYVNFSAEINPSTTEALIATLPSSAIKERRKSICCFRLPGGSVMHGFTLFNVLRAMPIKLITHNVGNVELDWERDFLAAAERYACPHSTFMFHGVGFDVTSGVRLEDKLLREHLDSISSDHRRIGAVVGQATSLKEEEVVNLFKEARTKDAAWAEKVGMIQAGAQT